MTTLSFTPWYVLLVQLGGLSLLSYLAWRLFRQARGAQPKQSLNLIEAIELQLPQTQCGKCGHSGCAPYAEAIAAGEAINKCPPGGDSTIKRLAKLLRQPLVPLDPECGEISPPTLVSIRESECIGCTKCIQACPVDAIVGAAKLMHTVIQNECTGCNLCIAPCPVDCIDILPAPRQHRVTREICDRVLATIGGQSKQKEQIYAYRKKRFESRRQRLARDTLQRRGSRRRSIARPENPEISDAGLVGFSRQQARVEIADAVARVKARRETSSNTMQKQTGIDKE